MAWRPIDEVEGELGTRLHRKLAAGSVPAYTDHRGQRWVWHQAGTGAQLDDVLWEVLAELRALRGALDGLAKRVDGLEGEVAHARTAEQETTRLPRPGTEKAAPVPAPTAHVQAAEGLLQLRASARFERARYRLVDDDPEAEAA